MLLWCIPHLSHLGNLVGNLAPGHLTLAPALAKGIAAGESEVPGE